MTSVSSVSPFGARYLEDYRAFPREADGKPWGEDALLLSVGGNRYAVQGLSPAQRDSLRALWPDFVREEPVDDASALAVFRTPASTFRTFDRWVYELELDYGEGSVRMAGLDLMARLELTPRISGAVWVATERADTFHAAFENFFRVVVAYSALASGGALFHSAAVVGAARRGWLFIGHSGAGKSTVSRLGAASGRKVLSDDLNPLLPGPRGGIDILGVPFLGDEGSRVPARHALAAIYRLEQGDHDAVRPMTRAETLASLVACSPYVNFDPLRADRLYSNLDALAAEAPAYVLTFRREGTFWPLLKE